MCAALKQRKISLQRCFFPTSENEDRLLVQQVFFSIADGAGGTGILCGEWAEYVLSHLPEQAISSFDSFQQWFENFAEKFVEEHEPPLFLDSFQIRKFYEEGSACTLAALWLEGHQAHWLTYGDAHVFHITATAFESAPFQSREEFSRGTHLLNWNAMPDPYGFKSGTFDLLESSTLLLATDEISKHIFYLRDSSASLEHALEQIYDAMENEQTFRQYIVAHPDIEEDDYTLIFIKCNILIPIPPLLP